MATVLGPKDAPKGSILGLNGVPVITCNELKPCDQYEHRNANYDVQGLNAAGVPTEEYCDIVSAELQAKSVCGCTQVCALVPDTVTADPGTALFTEEYANDGSDFPPLADAGAIFVGTVADSCGAAGLGRWDNVGPVPPTGFQYVNINVASANVAAAAA